MLSGLPVFYENFDDYGRAMTDHGVADRNDFFEE